MKSRMSKEKSLRGDEPYESQSESAWGLLNISEHDRFSGTALMMLSATGLSSQISEEQGSSMEPGKKTISPGKIPKYKNEMHNQAKLGNSYLINEATVSGKPDDLSIQILDHSKPQKCITKPENPFPMELTFLQKLRLRRGCEIWSFANLHKALCS